MEAQPNTSVWNIEPPLLGLMQFLNNLQPSRSRHNRRSKKSRSQHPNNLPPAPPQQQQHQTDEQVIRKLVEELKIYLPRE